MANHKSAIKRVRQNAKKRVANRYYKKTTRTAIKNLKAMEDKTEAAKFLPKVISMIDKLAKRNTITTKKRLTLRVS